MGSITCVTRCFLVTLLSLSTRLPASGTNSVGSGTCSLMFSGTSTLHDFEGSAAATSVLAQWLEAPQAAGRMLTIDAVFAVKDLTTQHAKRDRNMYAMFDQTHHPFIRGHLEGLPLPLTTAGTPPPDRASVDLVIQDRTNQVPVSIRNWKEHDGSLAFDVVFPVSLTRSGLKPPSVLGLIRVGDEVNVSAHVTLPLPSPASGEPRPTRGVAPGGND